MWSGTDGGSQMYVGVKTTAEATMAEGRPGSPQCQLVCVCVYEHLAAWPSAMILAPGARGPGFKLSLCFSNRGFPNHFAKGR